MALLKGINNSKSWTGVGDIIMVTRVIPFFSPLWFIIRHQNNTHTHTKHLCTAHQGTWGIYSSVYPEVGGLTLRGGQRVQSQASSGRGGSRPGQPFWQGGGGWRWWVGSTWPCVRQLEEPVVSEKTSQWLGEEKGKKAKKTEGMQLLAVCPSVLARGPPTDIWDTPTRRYPSLVCGHTQSTRC